MINEKAIDKIPGLKALLDKCQDDVTALTGVPVTVFYRIKFHHLSTSDLMRIVCDVCEVSWAMILCDSRKSHYVIARHLYCWFAFNVQKKNLTVIGRILGKDHTTVLYARNKVDDMKAINDELYMVPFLEIERRIDEIMTVQVTDQVKA